MEGMTVMALTGIVARYADAWNDHDAQAAAACFSPRGVRVWQVLAPRHVPGDPFPRFVGRQAIGRRIQLFMDSIPDLRLEVSALSEGSDDRVWTEWRITGTHAVDLGSWAARGEQVDFVGVSIYRVGPEGIDEERAYWDTLLMRGIPAGLAAV
jgi:hypothetical protein